MSFVDRFYKQVITYWAVTSRDAFGKSTFAAPVPFNGRWDNKLVEVLGPKGETLQCKSIVHYPENIAVAIDGYLFEGTSAALDPTQVAGAFRVQQLTSVPDLRNLTQVKVAML